MPSNPGSFKGESLNTVLKVSSAQFYPTFDMEKF
jgi:hypothetical protein